ncbi:divergent polysaccharide deacetylase family protein [Aliikangiella sp. IMCC44653]
MNFFCRVILSFVVFGFVSHLANAMAPLANPLGLPEYLQSKNLADLLPQFDSRKHDLPKIAIVVDDLGVNSAVAQRLLAIKPTLTAAILPHTPHAKAIAETANANGHQVIMHLPMEAFSRPDLLGPGALYNAMDKNNLQSTMLDSGSSIPHLVGFNNHMGSMLTENEQAMRWVMQKAKQLGWFFLDSKTSQESIAQEVAQQLGIPSIGRDIFLDHHTAKQKPQLAEIIQQRFERALKIADKNGQVVIICHPYPQTVDFLTDQLGLYSQQYQLVKLSDLITEQSQKLSIETSLSLGD